MTIWLNNLSAITFFYDLDGLPFFLKVNHLSILSNPKPFITVHDEKEMRMIFSQEELSILRIYVSYTYEATTRNLAVAAEYFQSTTNGAVYSNLLNKVSTMCPLEFEMYQKLLLIK